MRREWGRMALEGSDTVWENFDADASLCHAWAGAPTYHLSTKVLGVPLNFPELTGSDELIIAPQSESLAWARGVVPHAAGPIRVEWRIDGEYLRVNCDVPKGIKWRVAPLGRLRAKKLIVNA
jgi:alpha-L-rhamnosidase